MRIKVMQDIMAANDLIARENRRIFDQHGVFVVNLMSSPGAGKTTLLERTLAALKNEFAIAVIEGDIRGQLDAERIGRYGVPVLQINTDGHLSSLVQDRGRSGGRAGLAEGTGAPREAGGHSVLVMMEVAA